MALLGISLLVASVVYVAIRPPTWLHQRIHVWLSKLVAKPPPPPPTISEPVEDYDDDDASPSEQLIKESTPSIELMPPPPQPPTIAEPEPESPTTPKATSSARLAGSPSLSMPPPPPPSFSMPPPPVPTSSASMRPPPTPSSSMAPPPRPPTLAQFPAANSAQRARGPIPNRGAGAGGGGLAPPPTHSNKPNKPSRQVTLDPGHSPLDWARISGPNADLRGLDPSTPYMRVTPSMLKNQTGRKGKDAWMALNGKVYNVTPYAKFHPGGVPELMRGAGRDGTKLFGEVHPWVNYETMLSACLIGLLVDEPPMRQKDVSEMDQMD